MPHNERVEQVEIRFEPETGFISCTYPRGKVSATMAQQVVDALAPHHAKGAIFVLVDVRSVTGIDAEAREVFGKAGRRAEHLPPAFNATFGAPLPLRALANLITKFTRMTTMVVQHTADEAAARVWLTEKRRAYLARRAM